MDARDNAPYAVAVTTCTACGRENPGDAKFCNVCGAALMADGAPPREERKIVSALFVDLVGFTARAERLDPEDVRAIQTPYFQRVRSEVEAHGGTVEKFIGDAVMGVFGAPVAHGDDPERAVRAALAIRAAVAELNERNPELDLRVRLAVNTGEAIVSVAADVAAGEGLVTGDVVNTASRLQNAAPVDAILVGEETHRCTKSVIRYQQVDPVTVRGKEMPVNAWLALEAIAPLGGRPTAAVPIVGREHELNVLQGIWTRVVGEQRPHLVTVFGPAGIGKSRLAQEFGALVERDGARAIRGRSVPYGETTTYGAFTQHVKQLARIFDSDRSSDARAKLRQTVGELIADADAGDVAAHIGRLIGLDEDGAAADRDTLFFSVRRLLEAVARMQPTVLIFEDVHWADAGMLDLLEVLASRVHDVPLLLLALARPELLQTRPSWGGGLPRYTALPVEPLGTREATELAHQLLAVIHERSGDAREIAATAEGNPLFIEELAASLAEHATSFAGELPTTIRAIVSARLDVLPAAERMVLLDASVVGKIFWRGALTAMGSGKERLAELLDSLEGRDLIRREAVSRLRGDQQFSFKHVLIRDIAYATLPRPDRRERHELVARFLEQATPEIPAAASALAHHWREAGDEARAVDFLIVAAEQAGRGWAKDEAVAFYQQALALVPETDTERRRDIARRQAVALQVLYHVADAERLARRPATPAVEP
jgi:class 3 adenylate cyclase